MSKEKIIIRLLDCIAILVLLHLTVYGVFGYAVWGYEVSNSRGTVLVVLHLFAFAGPFLVRSEDFW